jgi:hypothetical protein
MEDDHGNDNPQYGLKQQQQTDSPPTIVVITTSANVGRDDDYIQQYLINC